MSFIGNIVGFILKGERIFNVTIEYRCLNCGEKIYRGPQMVKIKLNKKDQKEAIINKITEQILNPEAKDSRLHGFVISHGSGGNSTFHPIYPHECKDGKIGMSIFSALNYAQIDKKLEEK